MSEFAVSIKGLLFTQAKGSSELMSTKGIFHAFGLFWRKDEVNWRPGRGSRSFDLLGRQGDNRPNLRVANFRFQQGIYILYGDYGPHYVGLTRAQGLGKRLKDHLSDHHANEWDRFSWFAFGRVLDRRDSDGLQCFAKLPRTQMLRPKSAIGDIEAILIRAMALKNVSKMKFAQAEQWHQIKRDEAEHYYSKVRRVAHSITI